MVRALQHEHICVRYIPDCAVSAAVSDCDLIVVGAAAVTEDGGIVNRVCLYLKKKQKRKGKEKERKKRKYRELMCIFKYIYVCVYNISCNI